MLIPHDTDPDQLHDVLHPRPSDPTNREKPTTFEWKSEPRSLSDSTLMPFGISSNNSSPEEQCSKPCGHSSISSRILPNHNVTLSSDVLLMIFETLSKSSLRMVSQVSKAFHNLALPVLYHTVDFSAKPVIDLYGVAPRFWRPRRYINALEVRQWRFAQQITRKPSYGTLVRSFTWTMGFQNRTPLGFLIDEEWDETVIYTMLSHLTLATHINIDTSTTMPKTIPHLPTLFPSATHINLGGKTTYAFAVSILHNPTPTPLQSLVLDNVIEGGIMQDPASNESKPIARSYDDRERLISVPEIWPPESLPVQVHPSCMRRLLRPPLLQRCQNLRYLALRKQGQQHEEQVFPSAKHTGDRDVYDEWASFIRAVKPKVLLVAHLRDVERPYSGAPLQGGCAFPTPVGVRWPEIAPMDECLQEKLVPVLREGWAGLERLEVSGVSRKVLGGLEEAEGLSAVEVVIEEEMQWAWNATVGN